MITAQQSPQTLLKAIVQNASKKKIDFIERAIDAEKARRRKIKDKTLIFHYSGCQMPANEARDDRGFFHNLIVNNVLSSEIRDILEFGTESQDIKTATLIDQIVSLTSEKYRFLASVFELTWKEFPRKHTHQAVLSCGVDMIPALMANGDDKYQANAWISRGKDNPALVQKITAMSPIILGNESNIRFAVEILNASKIPLNDAAMQIVSNHIRKLLAYKDDTHVAFHVLKELTLTAEEINTLSPDIKQAIEASANKERTQHDFLRLCPAIHDKIFGERA